VRGAQLVELSDAIKSVANSDSITRSVQDALAGAHADGKAQLVAQYEAVLGRLWESSLEKVDRVTAHLLQFSDELDEGKNGEVRRATYKIYFIYSRQIFLTIPTPHHR
jgi:hypothetical protein